MEERFCYIRTERGKWEFVSEGEHTNNKIFSVKGITYKLMIPLYKQSVVDVYKKDLHLGNPPFGICVYRVEPVNPKNHDFDVTISKTLEDADFVVDIRNSTICEKKELSDKISEKELITYLENLIASYRGGCVIL